MKRLASLLLLLPVLASAMWAMPDQVPIGRLLKNVKTDLEKFPKDTYLHYLSARLHSLAFATEAKTVGVYKGKLKKYQEYGIARYHEIQQKRERKGTKL